MIHMVLGGCLGCAIYAKALGHYVAQGFMKYTCPALWLHNSTPIGGEDMVSQMLLYGVKAIYGWVCFACIALILGFFLFDSPICRHRSYMLPWRLVGEAVKKYYELKEK